MISMGTMRKTFLLLTMMLPVCLCAAQEPIRVQVKLVNVAFTARDARGALVDNLTRDDVEVLEDTVPQKAAFFSRTDGLPLTLGLIVDVSDSQEHFYKKHKHDLEVFLKEVLGPKDKAFLVCFGNHLRLASDFTNDSAKLMDSLRDFKPSGRYAEIGPKEARVLGTAFYDSVFYSVTQKLAGETGRRAIIIFSDGEDNSSAHDMMSTIETAQAADVLVFCVRYTHKEHGRLTARNQYGMRVMERIAHETGGAHFDAGKIDPNEYFRQIGEELRSVYELAYYPTNSAKDETFHKIAVRAKREGVKIRTKTGYFAR
jgi:Ca-activated chloride channel family protein